MSIINSDLMFEDWKNNCEEIRRACMGKNIKNGEIFFDKLIKKYTGISICKNKFNFQVDGNRCSSCNTLSYLFKDGNIVFDSPLVIESGIHKDEQIIISKHVKSKTFGHYVLDNSENSNLKKQIPQIDLCNNSFSSIFAISKLINKDIQTYHYIAISIMLNYLFGTIKGFTNRFLGVYVCDNINIIHCYPNLGVGNFNMLKSSVNYSVIQNNKQILNNEVVKGIFHQLIFYFVFLIKANASFCHGSPSLEFLSFSSEKINMEIPRAGKAKFLLYSPVRLYIDLGKYSSVVYDNYTKSKYHLVGNYNDHELSKIMPIHVSFVFEEQNMLTSTHCNSGKSKNPCLPEYIEKRKITYVLTKNILNAIKNSGFLFFSSLDLYLFITALLLEECFFISFMQNDKFERILSKIILPSQFDMYISELKKYHNSRSENSPPLTANQIANFIISIELEMYCEIIKDIWSEILNN